jgi:hypothetical protein
MSDLLPQIIKIVARIWQARSDLPRTCVLGADYERREARRSAIWVLCILAALFLAGWLFLRWIENS